MPAKQPRHQHRIPNVVLAPILMGEDKAERIETELRSGSKWVPTDRNRLRDCQCCRETFRNDEPVCAGRVPTCRAICRCRRCRKPNHNTAGHFISTSPVSNMASCAQLQSRLLQAPFDVRNAILLHLCPDVVHVHLLGSKLVITECVSPEAIHEDGDGDERREGILADENQWNFEHTFVWARRLMSTWGPHWRCEEVAAGKQVLLEPLLRVCKMM